MHAQDAGGSPVKEMPPKAQHSVKLGRTRHSTLGGLCVAAFLALAALYLIGHVVAASFGRSGLLLFLFVVAWALGAFCGLCFVRGGTR